MSISGWSSNKWFLNALVSLDKNLLLIKSTIDLVSSLPSTEVIKYLYLVVSCCDTPPLFNLSRALISASIFFSSPCVSNLNFKTILPE